MIREGLDDSAFRNCFLIALRGHPHELALHALQHRDLAPHFDQVPAGNAVRFEAGRVLPSAQSQELPDVVLRKTEVSRVSNEPQGRSGKSRLTPAPRAWEIIVRAVIYSAAQQCVGEREQFVDTRIVQPVMNETSLLLARDKPAGAETTQMVRYVGLGKAGNGNNLTNRQRPAAKRREN